MPKQLRTERGKGASRVGAPSPALTASASSALSSPLPHKPAQQQANMRQCSESLYDCSSALESGSTVCLQLDGLLT